MSDEKKRLKSERGIVTESLDGITQFRPTELMTSNPPVETKSTPEKLSDSDNGAGKK